MLTGTCHCGAVEIQVPTKPRRLTSCNCSICHRYGTLWAYYARDRVKIIAPKGALDRYSWGAKGLSFCRCANCGCIINWQPKSRTRNRMGVNFRNFDSSLLESVRIRRLDGAKSWKFLD